MSRVTPQSFAIRWFLVSFFCVMYPFVILFRLLSFIVAFPLSSKPFSWKVGHLTVKDFESSSEQKSCFYIVFHVLYFTILA